MPQSGPGAPVLPVFYYWRELLALLFANSALVLLVARLLFDDQVVKSMRRCKASVVEMINDWYGERRKVIDEALRKVDTHEDRMEAFEASLLRQGEALSATIGDHAARTTKALEAITGTLGAIQKEAAETAKAVARVEGALSSGQWNGVDRRARERRGGEL